LASRVLAFGLVTLLLLTGLLLWWEYGRENASIDAHAKEISAAYSDSIALSLWALDVAQAQLQIDGIARQSGVAWVSVLELPEAEASTPWVQAGRVDHRPVLSVEFPLRPPAIARVGDPTEDLGVLRVGFDLEARDARLLQRALQNVLVQAALLLIVCVLLLWLVQRLVIRDLRQLAARASGYSPGAVDVSFAVRDVAKAQGDEIDAVIGALESMRSGLADSYRALQSGNEALQRDVLAREQAEAQARFLARHDALSGLPNRLAFLEALDTALGAGSASPAGAGWVAFIDIDRFKRVNDALGHRFGDALLREAVSRLRASADGDVPLARLGGDRFGLLVCAEQASPVSIGACLDRLQAAFAAPLSVQAQVVRLSISIGAVQYPAQAEASDSLIRLGEAALALAKAEGGRCWRLYSDEICSSTERRHRLQADLRRALDDASLSLVYQPIFDSEGRLRSAEALVRWQHPEFGPVPPQEFVALSESIGLIGELGQLVLDMALAQVARWRDAGLWPDDASMAVNVSAGQLVLAEFEGVVLASLARHGVPPQQLSLEITESVLMGDLDGCSAMFARLRDAGVRSLIDDFGTGFSSLSYLGRLPVAGLKIDRSFVAAMGTPAGGDAVIGSVIDIARHFGLQVTAEGVETQPQYEHLRLLGCDRFQGFLLARPETAERLGARLAQHDASSIA
jgi:diguanylate cyclase (GGDEF)-like protein